MKQQHGLSSLNLQPFIISERRDRDIGEKDRNEGEKRKWESRTPAVRSCWETSGDGCWRERLSDRQRYKVLMSKTKRVLLACIQFPFIWTCVCFQRKCGECKSSEGTVWEQRHITCMWGDSVCTQCVSACRVCVCASGVTVCFSSCCFPACVWLSREDVRRGCSPTYLRPWFIARCMPSECVRVCEWTFAPLPSSVNSHFINFVALCNHVEEKHQSAAFSPHIKFH